MNVTRESTVGRIAADHPSSTRVFERHGIDYCCGGGVSLADACRSRGLDVERVIQEIRTEESEDGRDEARWSEAPLNDLVDHILAAYHEPLREELGRLEEMCRKVLHAHAEKEPHMLPALLATYLGLKAELEAHMWKEEQVLFPMIRRGEGARAGGPITVMEMEHDVAASALGRLRALTDDYRVPECACNTWRALWHGLAALEESLHRHIHLENNILFPRALAA